MLKAIVFVLLFFGVYPISFKIAVGYLIEGMSLKKPGLLIAGILIIFICVCAAFVTIYDNLVAMTSYAH